jgi:ATP-dependent DNA helicase DinG
VIEVEVHQQLRAFLREQGEPYWPHHLTMARLVARALRLGRSALIQAGAPSGDHGRYRLGYLMPALIWQDSVVLVVSEALQQRLMMVEIPRLRQWIPTHKAICRGDRWPSPDFQGLMLTSPQSWLSDRLMQQGRFPDTIPTIVDGVDDLETWVREQLTVRIEARDWDDLMLACADHADAIRDVRVQLTRSVFQHPANPYNCYLLDPAEQQLLSDLQDLLHPAPSSYGSHPSETEAQHRYVPESWTRFWQSLHQDNQLVWVEVSRQQGQFSLHSSPIEVASSLKQVWAQQPTVLIGGALDLEPAAPFYRERLGLDDTTCLKFSPDRQNELIQLYVPDRFPLPNTPEFQTALLRELRSLLSASSEGQGLTVLLIGDVPLKAQIGSVLASEFGSRVQVEKTCLDDQGILITGWEFWRQHQAVLPSPQLLIIATLPIPSLEDPLVAGRVAYYKHLRQDWFRLYLLPETLSHLQRAVAPVRETQGVVALLDNRVNYRSYGKQVLTALSPMARINYIDASLFKQLDYSVLDEFGRM